MLSARLKKIADCVQKSALAADVGTDHAYIPVYLVKNNIAEKCIATDISKGSVQKAQLNVSANKLDDKISVRCGNGLETLKEDEVPDCVIIAGMGGMLMCGILQNPRDYKRLVLQPQRDADKVRKTVHNIGYKITDEHMVFENGKYYSIIVCEKGNDEKYSEEEYLFGKKLIDEKNSVLCEFLESEIKRLKAIEERFSLPQKKLEEIKLYENIYKTITSKEE